jgi:hypothetical protein
MRRVIPVRISATILACLSLGLQGSAQAETTGPTILMDANSAASNPFGAYFVENRRAEGLNSFAVQSLSSVARWQFLTIPVVVPPETLLTSTQASMFNTRVQNGAGLVAMCPGSHPCSVHGPSSAARH